MQTAPKVQIRSWLGLIRYTLLLPLLFLLTYSAQAQSGGCANLDFSMGDFTNWNAYTGFYTSCCPTAGVVVDRHTIITTSSLDINTCSNLETIPSGATHVARLGNQLGGAQADVLEYEMTVDSSNSLLIYRYAVVMQDPSHPRESQPRFEMVVLDSVGNLIDPNCGAYSVTANSGIPGFDDCNSVRYKDWTTVGLNLQPYMGQKITIRYTTYDCGFGGHFGYAYLTVSCRPIDIVVDFCDGGTSANLFAPPGFDTYNWSTGGTTQNTTVNNPVPGSTVSCTLTAVNGCTAVINALMNPTSVTADFALPPKFCAGDPATFIDQSSLTLGDLDNFEWNFGDGSTANGDTVQHAFADTGTYMVQLIASRLSCSDTIVKIVTVEPNPTVNLGIGNPCANQGSVLFDQSFSENGEALVHWEWDALNDGVSDGTGSSIPFQFTTVGMNDVRLTVTDSIGCSSDSVIPVEVFGPPEAKIRAANVCVDAPVLFFDSSSTTQGYPAAWSWDFGDGSALDTVQNPEHKYAAPGSYFINFIVTTNLGCKDTLSQLLSVEVHPLPETDFVTQNTCLNVPGAFVDQSTILSGSITEWEWYFDQPNAIDSIQNPSYLFTDTGQFEVTLITFSAQGCATIHKDTVQVFELPDVQFDFDHVCLNEVASFQDLTSTANTPFSSWNWDFGDGQFSTIQNPQYLYQIPDTVQVKLRVTTDQTNCTSELMQEMRIYALPEVDFGFANACEDSVVHLTDLATSINGTPLSQWYWDIEGDGATDYSQKNAEHAYPQFGTYQIELRVVDSLQCTDSTAQQVVIHAEPTADYSFTSVCLNDSMFFQDLSTIPQGQITSWKWFFGDQGPISFDQNPKYLYTYPDTFSVYLTVESDSGCKGITWVPQNPIVYDLPDANFGFTSVCDYDSIPFVDSSKLVPAGSMQNIFSWDFGDGSPIQTRQHPTHQYPQFGYYPVTLTVSTLDGCADTTSKVVQVYESPTAKFANPTVCLGRQFQVNNVSVLGSSAFDNWLWDFGDGNTSTLEDPTHRYDTLDTYTLSLQVSTVDGCVDSTALEVSAHAIPVADFSYDLGCAKNPIQFYDRSSIASLQADDKLDLWDWDFADTGALSEEINPSYTYNLGSLYPVQLIVTSFYGCKDTAIQDVQVLQELKPDFLVTPVEGCPPLQVSIQNRTTFESGYALWYEWRQSDDSTIYRETDPSFTFYNRAKEPVPVSISLKAITDYCEAKVSQDSVVSILPQPTAGFKLFPEQVSVFDGLVKMEDRSRHALYHSWSFGDQLPQEYTASTSYRYMEPGTYPVQQWVENEFGCVDSMRKSVYIWPEVSIWIPNAFSPNGDGINDFFQVYGEGIDLDFKLQVFNRWGQLIFEGNRPDAQWNGSFEGQRAMEGVYTYRVSFTDEVNEKEKILTGSITLVRQRN